MARKIGKMKSHIMEYFVGTPSDYLILHAVIDEGKKNEIGREVEIWINPERLSKLFEIYQLTHHIGHAKWHLDTPEAELPCESCHK